jgi:hypothetical protein
VRVRLLCLVLGFAAIACASVVPTPTATRLSTALPTATSAKTPGEPPTPADGLTRFSIRNPDSTGLIAFDYPSYWGVLASDITARHYQWIPAVLGTGEWKLNCQTFLTSVGSGIQCGQDIFLVDPGEVVVELSTQLGPPMPEDATPPPEAIEIASGLRAHFDETTLDWQIYIPGWMQPLYFVTSFGPDAVDTHAAEVRALVESFTTIP